MYPTSKRILDQATLQTGDPITANAVSDFADANELEIAVTVHTAGTAAEGGDPPKLLVQHAAVNEEQYYVDFPTPVSVDLTQTGVTWIHVPYFMRYVGWVVTGTIGDAPVASLDVLTKG